MTPELRKRRVEAFIGLMNGKDPDALRGLITDDFNYELVWRMPGNEPICGKEAFLTAARAFFDRMFPTGLRFRFPRATADGEEVAVQAESETVAFNGMRSGTTTISGSQASRSRKAADTATRTTRARRSWSSSRSFQDDDQTE